MNNPLPLTLAGLTDEYARELLRFFARAPISLKLDIVRSKRQAYSRHGRQWLQTHPHCDVEVELACLMIACRDSYVASRSLKFKDSRDHEQILAMDRQVTELRLEQAKTAIRRPRKQATLSAIKLRLPVILALRERGHSWRVVAAYLNRYAGLKVSHSYLCDVITMLAGQTGRDQQPK